MCILSVLRPPKSYLKICGSAPPSALRHIRKRMDVEEGPLYKEMETQASLRWLILIAFSVKPGEF